jgi:hypothetical protein
LLRQWVLFVLVLLLAHLLWVLLLRGLLLALLVVLLQAVLHFLSPMQCHLG